MASVNKVIIIGNLGKDPELRYMPNGDAVANATVATTDTWKDKNGEKQEKTEWHRIVFYRKLAETVGQYLKKGMPVYVEGRLETKKWTDKSGVERYTTEIAANDMKMLGKKPDGETQDNRGKDGGSKDERSYNSESRPPKEKHGGGFDDMDDDIPF